MIRQLEEGEIMLQLSQQERKLLHDTLSRDREQKRLKKFLGEQNTPPAAMIRAIKHIQAIYKHSPVGLWQAWALGVIYGKRRDRKRRKKGAKSIAGRGSVTSKADCTNKPQQKEKSPASAGNTRRVSPENK